MYKVLSIKTIIALIFLYTAYFILYTVKADASALTLGIEPSILKIEAIQPADVITPLTIQNGSEDPITLRIVLKPFTATGAEDGTVSYLPTDSPEILKHVKLEDGNNVVDKITLASTEQKTLNVHVTIDKDQPDADYYFSVIFVAEKANQSGESNLSFASGGIGSNVLLSIGQLNKPKGFLTEFSSPKFLEKGPVPFTVRVKNTGTHLFIPQGYILITNMFGQTVGKVNLLPVNILAGTSRAIPDSLQNPDASPSATTTFVSEKPNALWPEKFLLGPYSAELVLTLSEEGPTYSNTIHFFAFPTSGIVGLFVAVLLILIVRERIKRRLK